ncbi:MAG: hypothetical protein ABII09_00605 [Planctomycetota bacterium]
MRSETHFRDVLDGPSGETVQVDYRIATDRGRIIDFAINVTLLENGRRVDVYRVDTKHGHLHEQRFWMSPKPVRLDYGDYETAFAAKRTEVMEKCARWARLLRESKTKKG